MENDWFSPPGTPLHGDLRARRSVPLVFDEPLYEFPRAVVSGFVWFVLFVVESDNHESDEFHEWIAGCIFEIKECGIVVILVTLRQGDLRARLAVVLVLDEPLREFSKAIVSGFVWSVLFVVENDNQESDELHEWIPGGVCEIMEFGFIVVWRKTNAGFVPQRRTVFRGSMTDVLSCDLNSQLGGFTVRWTSTFCRLNPSGTVDHGKTVVPGADSDQLRTYGIIILDDGLPLFQLPVSG
jgi:hypothetical protein